MHVAVTGASGLIGRALIRALKEQGHSVVPLLRKGGVTGEGILWDPATGMLDASALEGFDAVVHLAGENIGTHRWTAAVKREIKESRVRGTTLLAEALCKTRRRPSVFVSASAVGYYGAPGDQWVDEGSPSGDTFLAEVCRAWESAAQPARDAGIRVVHPRFGVVLSASGGALARMLPVFRAGLGGRIGGGRDWMSWVSLPDAVSALLWCLAEGAATGAVNIVSPNPVRNAEFTRTLGSALHRPSFLSVPALAVKLVLGEMGRELLLSGARVRPSRLERNGYRFVHPELKGALSDVLSVQGAG